MTTTPGPRCRVTRVNPGPNTKSQSHNKSQRKTGSPQTSTCAVRTTRSSPPPLAVSRPDYGSCAFGLELGRWWLRSTWRHERGRQGGNFQGGRGSGRLTAGRSSPAGGQSGQSCYTCGHDGQWSINCPHRTNTVLKVCYNCKKPDHVMADCPTSTGVRKSNASSSAASGEAPRVNKN